MNIRMEYHHRHCQQLVLHSASAEQWMDSYPVGTVAFVEASVVASAAAFVVTFAVAFVAALVAAASVVA